MLEHDALRSRWTLWHMVTNERLDLPQLPVGRQWSLSFNDEGFGCLHDGLECRWVATMLTVSCHQAPNGSVFLRDLGNSERWLRDFINGHTEHRLRVNLERTTEDVAVYWFAHASGGAHLWWSLPHVHQLLRVCTSATSSGWVRKGWTSWESFLWSLGLSHPHMRKQLEDRRSAAGGSDEYFGVETRVLPTASVSTFGFVALLATWVAHPVRHLRVEHTREVGKDVLTWLCSKMPVDEYTLRIVACGSDIAQHGLPIGDAAAPTLRIPVRGGRVLLADMTWDAAIKRERLVNMLIHDSFEHAEMSWPHFLLLLAARGNSMLLCFAQVVWHTGQALERAFLVDSGVAFTGGGNPKRERIDNDAD